ncbi:MAG: hypothetical protein PHT33_13100, partial [bacterium]|nr:hypothetical protein [bacterium]
NAQEALSIIKKTLGHQDVYFFGVDEPGKGSLLGQADAWKGLHEMGAKVYCTSKDWHYELVGFAEDIGNYGGHDVKREYAARRHALGGRIMSYAGPHTGPENPDLSRRNHGMLLYKAWYDGTGNYAWYENGHTWNDFVAPWGYRPLSIIYPTKTGVIDTIAWEGFREGIDDIRYATLLKRLATEAMDKTDVETVYSAKKALLWLEALDEKNVDLNVMRLEMIEYILKLRQQPGRGNR